MFPQKIYRIPNFIPNRLQLQMIGTVLGEAWILVYIVYFLHTNKKVDLECNNGELIWFEVRVPIETHPFSG